jgi:hypothetical protein
MRNLLMVMLFLFSVSVFGNMAVIKINNTRLFDKVNVSCSEKDGGIECSIDSTDVRPSSSATVRIKAIKPDQSFKINIKSNTFDKTIAFKYAKLTGKNCALLITDNDDAPDIFTGDLGENEKFQNSTIVINA